MNTNILKLAFLVVVMALPFTGRGQDEKAVLAALKSGDLNLLKSYLAGGTDPNLKPDGRSLLNWAIRFDQGRAARLLIEYGADVNETDDKLNSPLINAAGLNNKELCKILVDRGADPEHKNKKGRRASDFAYNYGTSPAYKYLVWMEKMCAKRDTMASMQDGPYIYRENSELVVMSYFEHDRDRKLTRIIEKTIWHTEGDTVVNGFGWDTKEYYISCRYAPDSCDLATTGNIFTVGDIHGKFRQMMPLLINNNIIDPEHNWTLGNGRLILLGDVFDRGGSVTETLWFLHRLQRQARESGGNVHLLLGNHEMMAMTRDYRYLNDKYDFFTSYFQLDYSQLFERNTVLGSWLRSQNVILRINDYLFIHAGISLEFAAFNYSYQAINDSVRAYLNSDYYIEKESARDRILGEFGPQWYRGYGAYGSEMEVTQEFVDDYLAEKNLKKMIIGHNEQLSITADFSGKVISADVAIDESGTSSQGLLIKGDELFRCYADGRKEKIE